jgi:hypothetical protein
MNNLGEVFKIYNSDRLEEFFSNDAQFIWSMSSMPLVSLSIIVDFFDGNQKNLFGVYTIKCPYL